MNYKQLLSFRSTVVNFILINIFFIFIAPPFKSLTDYRRDTGGKWKVRSSGKEKKQAEKTDVVICIGIMQWSDEECRLKARRGRRIALRTSTTEPYNSLLSKSVAKWREFHGDIFELCETYSLVLMSGQEANFIPGTNEPFTLKRYKEEVGKDYKRIVLYLCTHLDIAKHQNGGSDFYDIMDDSNFQDLLDEQLDGSK